MIHSKKIVVVLPAYKAENTNPNFQRNPFDIVDEVILVDDNSPDKTINVAKQLGIHHIIKHDNNLGYGGNQKTCYNKALELGANHHHAASRLPIHAQTHPLDGVSDCQRRVSCRHRIEDSRQGALKGGMPMYKYIANRFLTLTQNILMNKSCRNIIPVTELTIAKYCKASTTMPILTTLFSTTNSSRKSSTKVLRLPRLHARHVILRKLRRLILAEVRLTVLVC
jgi:hypothetical protein